MKYAGEWFVLMAWVAMIFVLVRPSSQGPTLVKNITSGITGIIGASTGGGTW